MERQGLIIGIDYTNEYSQVCYYNSRHGRPQSIAENGQAMRYLIPTAVCYNREESRWMIGKEAMDYAAAEGSSIYRDLLDTALASRQSILVADKNYTYTQFLAVFIGKLVELVQGHSGLMNITSVTVNLRKIDLEIKAVLEEAFGYLGFDTSKVNLVSCAESFAYFVMDGGAQVEANGSTLFDFGRDGFFAKQLSISENNGQKLVYVSERNLSIEFAMRDLASDMLRIQLDNKLEGTYEDIEETMGNGDVYFTGEGFQELWFNETRKSISKTRKAFRGSNIYVTGACLAGKRRALGEADNYRIVCKGRTKADISVKARYKGRDVEINLSPAAVDWYDAATCVDFIVEGDKNIEITVTSMISREQTSIGFTLPEFAERPNKATRIELKIAYVNDNECDVTITDKGLGAFWPASGFSVTKRINLEGYI